jgi:hypothetical protein
MRLRRASIIATLFLLASAATAYAECAWSVGEEVGEESDSRHRRGASTLVVKISSKHARPASQRASVASTRSLGRGAGRLTMKHFGASLSPESP